MRALKNQIDWTTGWIETIWFNLVSQWNWRFREPWKYKQVFLYESIFSKRDFNLARDSLYKYISNYWNGSFNLQFHWLTKLNQVVSTQPVVQSIWFFSATAYFEPNFMKIQTKISFDHPRRQENDFLIFHFKMKNDKNFDFV